MDHVYIGDIGKHQGQEVTIKGWLYNKRSSGKLKFLLLRDGTGVIQCVVFKGEVAPFVFESCDTLTQESSLIVYGLVRSDPRSPGGYELGVKDLQIVHIAQDYPITPKEHGVSFLMQHRHLWLRSSRQHAILRIRHEIIRSCRDFFDHRGFTLLDAPIFTPAACEGTTTLFETKYFDEKAYLTQSGQLYMEAGAMAFGKVYCFGPTFRAEKSKTRRHLTEFWMVEPEIAYCTLDEVMDLAEELVVYLIDQVLKNRRTELEVLERDISRLERVIKPFIRISYDEALDTLKNLGSELAWGEDLGGDEETVLSNHFDKPVLIHRYPAKCKAFYMKADPKNKELALGVDMLAPDGYGEIIGGGEREENLEVLSKKIQEHDLAAEAFAWYLDLRKYGSVPHSGFGLGIERMVSWICGLLHVREAIPFPRMLYHLYP